MGMFDTIYAELDCPFCGYQFRYAPMTWEAAEAEVRANKQFQIEERKRELDGSAAFKLQSFWAKEDGYEDIDAWIEQLDRPEHIESHRMRKMMGLADIQTKAFERLMDDFYVGDAVPTTYPGHYYIPEEYECPGCSTENEMVFVKVWIEIQDHHIYRVLTHDPETGQTGQIKYPKRGNPAGTSPASESSI